MMDSQIERRLGKKRTNMENENEKTATPKAEKKAKAPKAPKPPKAPKEPKEPKVAKVRPTPPLGDSAKNLFDDYKTLSVQDRNSFIENAREFERVEGVKASKSVAAALTVGTRVRVIGGIAKLFGKEGTITEARRVRIFVQIDGSDNKPAYLFASDVAPLEQLETETDIGEAEDVAQAV